MLGGKGRWILAAALLCGIFESSDSKITGGQKKVLFVNAKIVHGRRYPTEAIYSESGHKLCFSVNNNNNNNGAGCCQRDFDCNITITSDTEVILNKEILCKHNVVLMFEPDLDFNHDDCKPSDIYNSSSGFLYSIHKCLDQDFQSVRLSNESLSGKTYEDGQACEALAATDYKFKIIGNDNNKEIRFLSCMQHGNHSCSEVTTTTPQPGPTTSTRTSPEVTTTTPQPGPTTSTRTSPEVTTTTPQPGPTTSTRTSSEVTTTPQSDHSNCTGINPEVNLTLPAPDSRISVENAANIMNNISCLLDQNHECSTANIVMGAITGIISKLPSENQTYINFNLTTSGDMNDQKDSLIRQVRIPSEAVARAQEKNNSFVTVILFPGMQQGDPNFFFLNDEVIGIEMGTDIANLSQTIDIHYGNVNKNGNIASCRSWNGEGKKATWIPDGCVTRETDDEITCCCSHLTFFAILMSPPPGNMSSSDFQALTYITSIGCGLSMFFLVVGLFMHCLIRKGKASQATQILMNLFVAMLTLNLSFLVNESIAELGVFGACVAVAAVMHYAMLATITWFFMQALHLYLNLRRLQTDVKHYMKKICAAGWVTPAVVVIILAALSQYNYLAINVEGGKSTKMCFISDAAVHQGVNIGYYAVVFVFTFTVFIITLRQIVLLKPAAGKPNNKSLVKTNAFSVFCLFLLLGITWAFAFFSHGPLLIPSYYIFTILNSLQGFFLFIYYYNSRKAVAEDSTASGSSNATLNSTSSPQK